MCRGTTELNPGGALRLVGISRNTGKRGVGRLFSGSVRAARAAEVADQFSFQQEVSELVEDSDVDFRLNDTVIDDDDSLEDSKLIDDSELSA